jgi:hypothetical protein
MADWLAATPRAVNLPSPWSIGTVIFQITHVWTTCTFRGLDREETPEQARGREGLAHTRPFYSKLVLPLYSRTRACTSALTLIGNSRSAIE